MLESFTPLRSRPLAGGSYEWVAGRADYAVDPADPGTARIADITLAPRGSDGLVRFSGDVVVVRPAGGRGGSRRALVEVPNRGRAALPFCNSPVQLAGTGAPMSTGDGYLLEEGWTIVLPGWQWDVPDGFLSLDPPVADTGPGWLRADFRIEVPVAERTIADTIALPGMPPFTFAGYPAADTADPAAVLRVRVAQLGEAAVIPRQAWQFTSPQTIALDGGFQPNRWYELIYRSAYAPVAGTGLLAVRDFGAYLRAGHDAVLAHGVSQSGRFLRQFLFDGLNVAEDGSAVFDGVLAEIASARRGEFSRRYAQPGLLAPMMPEYGPPYDSAALLARQRERGGVPKLMLVNSAAEYWRGDGALVHQDPVTGADLPEDTDTRAYLISGTDHLGALPLKTALPLANPPHFLDPQPVMRALFAQLQQWAAGAAEPEPSMVPRRSDGTAADRQSVLAAFPAAARPDPAYLPYTPDIDPDVAAWPLPLGAPRVALVSAVDDTGNEAAGIRLPAVQAGAAAYTGWNPRRHADGLPDVLYDLAGSALPGRAGRAAGAAEITAAARALADRRLLLPRDVDRVIRQAAAGPGGPAAG